MTDRWDSVTALFAAARALAPPLREKFLELACENDDDTRREIEALLESDREDGFLTETPWTLIGDALRRKADPSLTAQTGVRPLAAATRLGSYEIQNVIGVGSMGEVYRAFDTKLNRAVALKLLPDAFVRDPERLGRFLREAQVLASLNHPNIAHIYGFEQSGDRPFLILELVDGESLADHIARGALPYADAVAIGRQIADALEAAHDRGVVHRDLKPANINVRGDGTVKVLDFGLAKALDWGPGGASGAIKSPAVVLDGSQEGVILGTAAYMSPEQAKGKATDRRADVWAFGVVLYEMLTGHRPFGGESASEVMASVVRDEPDWTRLPANLPDATRRLLHRCLEKDPKQRLSSVGDSRFELMVAPDAVKGALRTARASSLGWMMSAAAGVALIAASQLFGWPMRRTEPDAKVVRVSVLGPAGLAPLADPSESAISPDGRSLVLTVANDRGDFRLWLRRLNDLEPHPLPGTEVAVLPFWSPDSRQIAFFADDKLKRVSATGGPVEVVCDAKGPRGGTWGSSGSIVFAPTNSGPLYAVSPDGREPHAVTSLDAKRGETSHRFPWFLPDGRHFLYAALPPHNGKFDLFVGSVDGTTGEFVTSADGAAVYADPGYMLFPRQNALVAQRFDAPRRKLLGEPIAIGEVPPALGALYNAGRAVTVSNTGTIAYLGDRLPNTRLEWFDGSGRALGTLPVPEGRYNEFAFSPDGRRLSVVRYDSVTESDIWVIDLERGGATRLTYGPALNVSSAWSPDGTRILFDSDRNGSRDLFIKTVGGAAPEEPLYASKVLFKYSRSWSPDGKWIVFDQLDPQTNRDLWILPVDGHGPPRVYLRTPATEGWGQVSPDGRRLAYVSVESGRNEIYVDSFPTPRRKIRVTENGGTNPVWRRDGRELAFMSLDNRSILVADVARGPNFRTAAAPHTLFLLPNRAVYASPTPDFRRVLVASPVEENTRSSFTLVLNWVSGLERR